MQTDEESDFISDSSDSDEESAARRLQRLTHEASIFIPEYSPGDLAQLQLFIQQVFTSHELKPSEVTQQFKTSTEKWIKNINEPTLFVYFDQGFLSASSGCPTVPVNQLAYLVRAKPQQVFTLQGFHDEITFGTFHDNPDEAMLQIMQKIYAPLILQDERWAEDVKANLLGELHDFMAQLTDLSAKIGSMIVFYIPNEGHDLSVVQAVQDKPLVKRYEAVAKYWITQIRSSLGNLETEYIRIKSFQEEHDFWERKFDTLSAVEVQLSQKNIEHILAVIVKSQSLLSVEFISIRQEIKDEIEQTQKNRKFIWYLLDQLEVLENSETPRDLPKTIPEFIYMIKVVSKHCDFYSTTKMTERLFGLLCNEVIAFCDASVDVSDILAGHPRYGIKMSDMSIDCCVAFKLIYRRLFAKLQNEEALESWGEVNEKNFFDKIDAFIQRLQDIMDICETMVVFGRQDETVQLPKLRFGCSNAKEFKATCLEIEKRFEDGLSAIKGASQIALDISSGEWYEKMATFKNLIKSLDGNVQSLLENIFNSIDNVEEALDVLTTLHNFTLRKSLQAAYNRKVEDMWKMFEKDVMALSKDITQLDKERNSCLPTFAGRSIVLQLRTARCERLHKLLIGAEYLPTLPVAIKVLEMFEATIKNVKKKIEDNSQQWSDRVDPKPINYLQTTLINRSSTHKGLLECNIDRKIIPILDESRHFTMIDVLVPAELTKLAPKTDGLHTVFSKVVYVVLIYNKILQSLSSEERLLFKEHMRLIDKKIAPGMSRLTFNNAGAIDYITECFKHLEELRHFVEIYKIVNAVSLQMFEDISKSNMLVLDVNKPASLSRFYEKFKRSRNESVLSIGSVYKKIVKYIITVYDGFDLQFSPETGERWIKYIRRIDALGEYAILGCAKNTFRGVESLLSGDESGPFIDVQMALIDKTIAFEPPIEKVEKVMKTINADVLKSISKFKRLNNFFGLPETPQIREFTDIVQQDPDCESAIWNSKQHLDASARNTSAYIQSWLAFAEIWENDVEVLQNKYVDGLDLKDFQTEMMKLVDVERHITEQDMKVGISFMLINCFLLKEAVLQLVTEAKRFLKHALCDAAKQKVMQFEIKLASRVNALDEQPKNFHQLESILALHAQSVKETEDRKQDMEEIREFHRVLVSYNVDIPSAIQKKLEALPVTWKRYNDKLYDLREKLSDTKDTFKTDLMAESKALQNEVENLAETLNDYVPTTSELSSADGLKIISLIHERLDRLERQKLSINEQAKFYHIAEVFLNRIPFIRSELELLSSLWKLVAEWEAVWSQYQEAEFSEINFDDMERAVMPLLDRLNKAYEANKERKWDFLNESRRLAENLKKAVPLFRNLQNGAMKTRHWDQIRELAKLEIDETNLKLKFILDAGMLAFHEPIQGILNSATMELEIEDKTFIDEAVDQPDPPTGQ